MAERISDKVFTRRIIGLSVGTLVMIAGGVAQGYHDLADHVIETTTKLDRNEISGFDTISVTNLPGGRREMTLRNIEMTVVQSCVAGDLKSDYYDDGFTPESSRPERSSILPNSPYCQDGLIDTSDLPFLSSAVLA